LFEAHEGGGTRSAGLLDIDAAPRGARLLLSGGTVSWGVVGGALPAANAAGADITTGAVHTTAPATTAFFMRLRRDASCSSCSVAESMTLP
jgi:hypothetical protein